jgi:hypothetical protein
MAKNKCDGPKDSDIQKCHPAVIMNSLVATPPVPPHFYENSRFSPSRMSKNSKGKGISYSYGRERIGSSRRSEAEQEVWPPSCSPLDHHIYSLPSGCHHEQLGGHTSCSASLLRELPIVSECIKDNHLKQDRENKLFQGERDILLIREGENRSGCHHEQLGGHTSCSASLLRELPILSLPYE